MRPATPADFAFIRSLAGRPDYAPFISDDDEDELAAHLATSAHRLLIWGDQQGFALYCGIGEPSGAVELRRLALAQTGRGEGQAFLRAMVDFAFRDLKAARLWLDASSENPRAQASYLKAGFTFEGRMRSHWYRPALGRNVDLMLYGMLRAEWQALPPLTDAPLAPLNPAY
nr:GNAT family protein [Stagnihabitans tardus]